MGLLIVSVGWSLAVMILIIAMMGYVSFSIWWYRSVVVVWGSGVEMILLTAVRACWTSRWKWRLTKFGKWVT